MTFPRRPARRETTPVDERHFVASQWRMMWRKLVRHRLAVVAAFAEFVAPAAGTRNNDFIHAPRSGSASSAKRASTRGRSCTD